MNLPFPDPIDELSPPPFPGKDEMNFAEFPITLLTDRAPKGQKSIKFEDTVYDDRRRRTITRRRLIEGSEEYGLPTATDDLVILALIQLTKLSNFTSREVEFTRLELIRMLGWPNEGKSYDRIKLSLQRIANVTYSYDNAWWDPRQKSWTTKIFHILDTVEINDSRNSTGQGGLFPSRIVWNEVVFDSFQAGFLRNIDFNLCIRLEHPIALRMYRFLGKRFYAQTDLTFDLKEFAYNHINLGRTYEGGTQIARKLKPAIEELEKAGFLEPLAEKERFIKKGWDWSIRLVQKKPNATVPLASPSPPEIPPLAAELVARGVARSAALELVRHYPAERIRTKIEVFDWQVAQRDTKIASPEGYLVKSITDDYQTPKGFVSAAERQVAKERLESQARQEAEKREREQEEKSRARAEREAITAYRSRLMPEELAACEVAALAQADDDARRNYDDPAMQRFRKTILHRITDGYIRSLLVAEGKLSGK